MRVAVGHWAIRDAHEFSGFSDHAHSIVSLAGSHGVGVLVLPELIGLELLAAAGDHLDRLADFAPQISATFADLAATYAMTVVAGSHIVRAEEGLGNSALTVTPSGEITWTPKQVLTQWELHEMRLRTSRDWSQPTDLGVAVCYDCEFPEGGRRLAETGRLIVAVPSFTETDFGFHRVRYSCHARAIENQIFVLHAALAGTLGREPVPQTAGRSAILAPSVAPFPADGVIAETAEPDGIAWADIDFGTLKTARGSGDVRNWEDRHASEWRVP
jgi:predicted amidohydrolase